MPAASAESRRCAPRPERRPSPSLGGCPISAMHHHQHGWEARPNYAAPGLLAPVRARPSCAGLPVDPQARGRERRRSSSLHHTPCALRAPGTFSDMRLDVLALDLRSDGAARRPGGWRCSGARTPRSMQRARAVATVEALHDHATRCIEPVGQRRRLRRAAGGRHQRRQLDVMSSDGRAIEPRRNRGPDRRKHDQRSSAEQRRPQMVAAAEWLGGRCDRRL